MLLWIPFQWIRDSIKRNQTNTQIEQRILKILQGNTLYHWVLGILYQQSMSYHMNTSSPICVQEDSGQRRWCMCRNIVWFHIDEWSMSRYMNASCPMCVQKCGGGWYWCMCRKVVVIHIYERDVSYYGVATMSRLLKSIGLFCKRALQKRPIFSKETYNLKEPTNRSHPIYECDKSHMCAEKRWRMVMYVKKVVVIQIFEWWVSHDMNMSSPICVQKSGGEWCWCMCRKVVASRKKIRRKLHSQPRANRRKSEVGYRGQSSVCLSFFLSFFGKDTPTESLIVLAVHCVLQCVAVCCSVLQCVAVTYRTSSTLYLWLLSLVIFEWNKDFV